MYTILSIIVIIIIVEFYNSIKGFIPDFKIESTESVIVENDGDDIKLNKYETNGDKKIYHDPGKIMIINDYNIFINTENYNSIMKKNLLYNIRTPFELEILNVNSSNENTIYYYYINNK